MNRRLPSRVTAIATSLTVASTLVLFHPGPAVADGGAAEAPANLRVEALEPELITLAWDPVPGAARYSVVKIPLEVSEGYGRTKTADTIVTLDDLTWDAPYKLSVTAYVPTAYPNSYSAAATIIVTTGLPDGYVYPGAPTGVRVERAATGRIERLHWDAGEGFGPLTYQIHFESGVPDLTGVFGHTSGLSFPGDWLPFEGGWLAPGQALSISITATDQAWHTSPRSEPLILTCCPL